MLKFKNVSFRYTEKSPFILSKFNIDFPTNKISIIMSANGLGKTTILKLASKILFPTSGRIINDNKKISYVFQEDRLIDELTVFQNLQMIVDLQRVEYQGKKLFWDKKKHKFEKKTATLKRKLTKEEIAKAINDMLKQLDIAQFVNYYPSELSGSMKKRVALARAFLHPSQLLLMDEPFNNLDIKLKNEVINCFIKLWTQSKKTVLFVTHSADEALTLGERIYFLDGKPMQLKKKLLIEGDISKRDISSNKMNKYRKQILNFFLEQVKKEHK